MFGAKCGDGGHDVLSKVRIAAWKMRKRQASRLPPPGALLARAALHHSERAYRRKENIRGPHASICADIA